MAIKGGSNKGRGLVGNSDKLHLMCSMSDGEEWRWEGGKKGGDKPDADL